MAIKLQQVERTPSLPPPPPKFIQQLGPPPVQAAGAQHSWEPHSSPGDPSCVWGPQPPWGPHSLPGDSEALLETPIPMETLVLFGEPVPLWGPQPSRRLSTPGHPRALLGTPAHFGGPHSPAREG